MDIWLLRHAAAEDGAPSGRDADRRLTPEGPKIRRGAWAGLSSILAPEIRVVLTSPYRRARETAEPPRPPRRLARSTGDSGAGAGRDPSDILAELEAEGERASCLVGHGRTWEALGRLLSVPMAASPAE